MSLNKVILIGNLTRNAEVRKVGQSTVASIGVATSERYKDAQGNIQERTEFHNVEYWNPGNVTQFLVKGQQVYVEGSIRTEKFTGNDGVEKSVVKIRAFAVQLLGNRQQPQAAPQQPGYAPAPPQYQQPAAPQYQQSVPPQYQQPGYVPQRPQAPAAPARPAPPTPPMAPQNPQFPQPGIFEPAQHPDDLPF